MHDYKVVKNVLRSEMLLSIKVEFVIFVRTCVYRRSSQFCQSKQYAVKTLNFFLQSGIVYKKHS